MDAGGGGDDVDDGVDCAYFVEVDFLYGDVVDLGFGGAEEFEGLDGGLFDGGGEVCGVDQIADDGQGAAVDVLVRVVVVVSVADFVLVLGLQVVLVGVSLLFLVMTVSFFGRLCAFVDVNLCGGDSAAVYFFDFE